MSDDDEKKNDKVVRLPTRKKRRPPSQKNAEQGEEDNCHHYLTQRVTDLLYLTAVRYDLTPADAANEIVLAVVTVMEVGDETVRKELEPLASLLRAAPNAAW